MALALMSTLLSRLAGTVYHLQPAPLVTRGSNPMGQMITRGSTILMRPRKMKYRKVQKNNRAVIPATSEKPVPPTPHYKQYGIYALGAKKIRANQLEAARMALVRAIGRRGSAIKRMVFPHIPVTKKPLGTRMGKGKGAVEYFVSYVKPGMMIFEFDSSGNLKQAQRAVQFKLPIKVGFVERSVDNRQ